MKKTLALAAAALLASSAWARMPEASDITIRDFNAAHEADRLNVALTYDLANLPTGTNIETRLTPLVCGATDTVALRPVIVAGRNRMIQAHRTGALKGPVEYYRSGKTKNISYSDNTQWQQWMENATIDLLVENLGCCESRKTLADRPLARLDMGERQYETALEFVTPTEERVKIRNAKGVANVDFQLNKTNILPDYRNNPAELAKIRATVDSIKLDPDTKITKLTITGYASPEGSYANNERLAKGRTEALAEYVRKLYTFPKDLMKTSWVAEDWAGLKTFVSGSNLSNKKAILAIIDSSLEPDAKDAKIRNSYPSDYDYMLRTWYPALRHSEYVVEYEVKKYTDPKEIAKVFAKAPGKLSLRELFIYAETLDPQSKEFADVFYTAAKLAPEDATANLNAGNCSLREGNLKAAAAYLAKAGDTPQAAYARGVLAAKQGEYEKAKELFDAAKRGGIDTTAALAALTRMTAPEVIQLD